MKTLPGSRINQIELCPRKPRAKCAQDAAESSYLCGPGGLCVKLQCYLDCSTFALAMLLSVFLAAPGFAQTNGAGSALNFDGASGHVRVPSGVWFNGNFTVEGWVYVRSYNNWSRLIDFGNGAWVHNVYLAVSAGDSGYPWMGVFNNGDAPTVGSSQQLPLNQWAHLAATFNAGTASIYINGSLVGSGTIPVTPPNVTRTNNYIGRSNWGADGYANAIFDEVRIWNIARTPTQIAGAMRYRLQGNEANLVGYWRFNENSGTQAGGTGGTGTLAGGVSWTNSTAPISALSLAGYWRMGENDVGAAPGATNTVAVDSAGPNNLTVSGRALYSTDVAAPYSSLSVNFAAPQSYGLRSVVSTAQDNFGVEAWVKPASVTNGQVVVYNGHTGTSGWGIVIDPSATYAVLFGGKVVFGSGPATANAWTHVALVRDSGLSTLYVNGVASGTSTVIPNLPAGSFAIAAPPQNPTAQSYVGSMDEVRVFTFAPGQFTTNDLLLQRLRVTTLAATDVTSNSATLNGIVDPNGVNAIAFFRYGVTTSYGQTGNLFAILGNSAAVGPQSVITGLSPGTRYHFQLVATNSFTVYSGEDQTFRTPGPVTVTTLADDGPGSLREGLVIADDGGTIRFATTGTIALASGELRINKSVSMVGPGAANLAISGNLSNRIFSIASNAAVTISGLTLSDGHPPDAPAAGDGGAINNAGTLLIVDCVISNNAAGVSTAFGGRGGHGGAIFSSGALTINTSMLCSNMAGTGAIGAPGAAGAIGNTGADGGDGGAIYATGPLTLSRSTIADNNAGTGGTGGLGGGPGGILLFTAADGGAGGRGGYGGGICAAGPASVASCALYHNSAGKGGTGGTGGSGNTILPGNGGRGGLGGDGGAIYNLGSLDLSSSTVHANHVGTGGSGGSSPGGAIGQLSNGGDGGNGGRTGGIYNRGTIRVLACTVNGNSAADSSGEGGPGASSPIPGFPGGNPGLRGADGFGGGIFNESSVTNAFLRSSIVAANLPGQSAPDLHGPFTSEGHNLIGEMYTAGSANDGSVRCFPGIDGNIVGVNGPVDPRLAPLSDNGGPTLTCALLPDSPALDAGDDSVQIGDSPLTTDQRGEPRRSGGHVDMGAYELNPANFPLPVVTALPYTGLSLDPSTGLSTVTLHALANPNGLSTTVFFQYGLTANYGASSPSVSVGYVAADIPANVALTVPSGFSYHYRAVATSAAGSASGPDQILATQAYYPPGDTDGDGVVSQNELDSVLSNYWAHSPLLQITNTAGLGGTNVTFELSHSTAGSFSVEYTTDLVNWFSLGLATPRYEFTDTNAPAQPQRHYRLRWP